MGPFHNLIDGIRNAFFPNPPHITFLIKRLTNEGSHFLPRAACSENKICSIFLYTSTDVRSLIHEMKYRRNNDIAYALAQSLHDDMAGEIAEHPLEIHAKPILTYIPSTRRTKWNRGFQHIDTLRDALQKADSAGFFEHKFPLLSHKVQKKRQTQMKTRKERLENMRNVFEADPYVSNKIVFLVDDVTTTGATLLDAERALIEAGARKVYLFALAH